MHKDVVSWVWIAAVGVWAAIYASSAFTYAWRFRPGPPPVEEVLFSALTSENYWAGPGSFKEWNKLRYVEGGWRIGGLTTHTFVGGLGLLGGLAQFVPPLRARYPRVHRAGGYIFLTSMLIQLLGMAGPLWVDVLPLCSVVQDPCLCQGKIWGGPVFAFVLVLYWLAAVTTMFFLFFFIARGNWYRHRFWAALAYSLYIGTVTLRYGWAMFFWIFGSSITQIHTNLASVVVFFMMQSFATSLFLTSLEAELGPVAPRDSTIPFEVDPQIAVETPRNSQSSKNVMPKCGACDKGPLPPLVLAYLALATLVLFTQYCLRFWAGQNVDMYSVVWPDQFEESRLVFDTSFGLNSLGAAVWVTCCVATMVFGFKLKTMFRGPTERLLRYEYLFIGGLILTGIVSVACIETLGHLRPAGNVTIFFTHYGGTFWICTAVLMWACAGCYVLWRKNPVRRYGWLLRCICAATIPPNVVLFVLLLSPFFAAFGQRQTCAFEAAWCMAGIFAGLQLTGLNLVLVHCDRSNGHAKNVDLAGAQRYRHCCCGGPKHVREDSERRSNYSHVEQ